MRIVVAIDGELLVPANMAAGISGQKDTVTHVIKSLEGLLSSDHELVIVHGNAPQVGFVLLRADAASHIVHGLPLDLCGSDTQGATGYMLQQAIHNWGVDHQRSRQACTLVTQVVVDMNDQSKSPTRGIGPYYDRDKAQMYASMHGWQFVLVTGMGYRRAVPALMPKRIIEVDAIRKLLDQEMIVVCAGGGGIPVMVDASGQLKGVDVVVNKAYTTSMLASEVQADGLVFVTLNENIDRVTKFLEQKDSLKVEFKDIDKLTKRIKKQDNDIYHKLLSIKKFLQNDGTWALISPCESLENVPEKFEGILINNDR